MLGPMHLMHWTWSNCDTF